MSRDEETLYLTVDCIYLIAVSRAKLWKSRFGGDMAYCPFPAEYSTLPSVGLDDLVGVAVGPFVGIVAPNGTMVSNCTLKGADTNLYSDIVAVDGAAYITTWERVLRYSYANSSIVWETRVVPDPIFKYTQGATLGRGGRTVYVPDGNYVLALEATTGRILWNTTVGPQATTAFYTSGVACECPAPYTVTRCNSACYLE
jgi:outer membrane protein assembly factor BamB